MIVLPGNNPERIDAVLVKFLKEQKTLDGKKIAVLGGTAEPASRSTRALVPALEDARHPDRARRALLNIGTTGDTTDAQTQLDSFIERWKGDKRHRASSSPATRPRRSSSSRRSAPRCPT